MTRTLFEVVRAADPSEFWSILCRVGRLPGAYPELLDEVNAAKVSALKVLELERQLRAEEIRLQGHFADLVGWIVDGWNGDEIEKATGYRP